MWLILGEVGYCKKKSRKVYKIKKYKILKAIFMIGMILKSIFSTNLTIFGVYMDVMTAITASRLTRHKCPPKHGSSCPFRDLIL